MWDLIIKNGRVITMESPQAQDKAILIKDGIIVDIVDNGMVKELDAHNVIDATGLVVMPGLVDCHTHLCEYATEEFTMLKVNPKKWLLYQTSLTV